MSITKASDPIGRLSGGRKLIAVVHADMVGYSRLIGLDDVGTLDRLRRLRSTLIDPAIHEHGGRLVNTGGDSLLIVFDSVDGAVRFALKVQQEVPGHDHDQPPDRAIRFRVGINVGDVIPDGTDVHGDVVNVAARLQAACPPGGICVSRAVREHVHDRLDLDFRGTGIALSEEHRPASGSVCAAAGLSRRSGAADNSSATAQVPPAPAPGLGHYGCCTAAHLRCGRHRLVACGHPCHHGPEGARPARDRHSQPGAAAFGPGETGHADGCGVGQAPRLSLVVLPFNNLGGEGVNEDTVDGITEDLTTDLSRWPDVLVIARNSAFTYKGKPIDIKRVGEELGVRYAVEGSVRKVDGTLRVTVQLDFDRDRHPPVGGAVRCQP